jgi:hypothetical protein
VRVGAVGEGASALRRDSGGPTTSYNGPGTINKPHGSGHSGDRLSSNPLRLAECTALGAATPGLQGVLIPFPRRCALQVLPAEVSGL